MASIARRHICVKLSIGLTTKSSRRCTALRLFRELLFVRVAANKFPVRDEQPLEEERRHKLPQIWDELGLGDEHGLVGNLGDGSLTGGKAHVSFQDLVPLRRLLVDSIVENGDEPGVLGGR
ncbi:uncharacterized protein LOC112343407 isoform X2 [Selaginella moellendorffii]|uniref:uncharacterized protein LOC112343407 isoform X2 n=1 Tax=Selaginella moellendorffii TaxID=88036 RepID=UPI000D1C471B|nr:uncharacterized protein LOC112343407 isoform X2 [Selaginella moellendorffii]|eukprot:XP_024522563.1 uncharacterized protein LOC112343407 isoform X2 [Selaginella moellendorffii]